MSRSESPDLRGTARHPRRSDRIGTDEADRYDTASTILLGLAAGAGTVLVLLASIAYFPVGDFLLPLVPDL